MEIGIVIENNYPLDREVRTRKLAKTLHSCGYSTSIFAINTSVDPARGALQQAPSPPVEQLEYAKVERFSWFQSVPLLTPLVLLLPFNPLWIAWLVVRFRRNNVDLAVASDMRAGPTAIVAAKLVGVPVIVDVRENYTEYARVFSTNSLPDRLKHSTLLIKWLETFVFLMADQVWVVTEERREVLSHRVRKYADVKVVKNVPSLSNVAEIESRKTGTPFEVTWPGFTFVYVGVINDFRGLDQIIQALAVVPSEVELHVAIAGEGPHRNALERLTKRLGVEESVTFTGWIDSEEVPAFLATGDVGLIPHDVNGFTNTTLPNKLFDCMLEGLPVLVSDMDPVTRIVSETGCGVVIPRDATPEEIAELMVDMKESGTLEEMGESGRAAVESIYNWDVESEVVLDSIEILTS